MAKFTFKRQPKATGLARIANPYSSVDVKYKGKTMGIINPPSVHGKEHVWSAGFSIKTEKNWKWLFFKKTFQTEKEAREFFQEQIGFLLMQDLHYFED